MLDHMELIERNHWGYPVKVSATELEPGDLVPGVGTVEAVLIYQDDPRWICRVTWDDGASTLYTAKRGGGMVQRIKAAALRNAVNVCIVEASADEQEVS